MSLFLLHRKDTNVCPYFPLRKNGICARRIFQGTPYPPDPQKKMPYLVKNQRLIRADYCKITYDFQNQNRDSNLYFEYYEFGTTFS